MIALLLYNNENEKPSPLPNTTVCSLIPAIANDLPSLLINIIEPFVLLYFLSFPLFFFYLFTHFHLLPIHFFCSFSKIKFVFLIKKLFNECKHHQSAASGDTLENLVQLAYILYFPLWTFTNK